MLIIKQLLQQIYYFLDSYRIQRLPVKIEHFTLDAKINEFFVFYRLGRHKIFNQMRLADFEKRYFDKINFFDLHRLTKFATLQDLLKHLLTDQGFKREYFFEYIDGVVKNDQLF